MAPAKTFICVGIPVRNDQPGEEWHEIEGSEWWHNAYAGPFCLFHMLDFRVKAIQHFQESGNSMAYEDGRLQDIEDMQEMVFYGVMNVNWTGPARAYS